MTPKTILPSIETKFTADDRGLRTPLDRSAHAFKKQEARIDHTGHALRSDNQGFSVLSTTRRATAGAITGGTALCLGASTWGPYAKMLAFIRAEYSD